MVIRKLRLRRGWSQEQLAQLSGLSVRTIQRLERGATPGLESLNSLAAVFEMDLDELKESLEMPAADQLSFHEQQIMEQVRELKGFYTHLLSYIIGMIILFTANLLWLPQYIWAGWTALGWGVGVLAHAMHVFEFFSFFGPEWERRQVEKRLGRKL